MRTRQKGGYNAMNLAERAGLEDATLWALKVEEARAKEWRELPERVQETPSPRALRGSTAPLVTIHQEL